MNAKRTLALTAGLMVVLFLLILLPAHAAPPATAPAGKNTDVLYSDPVGSSSATITQCLPNSSTPQLLLTNVKRITVTQEILVIEWGETSTTLLPRQYVSAITLNKRVVQPATQPAAPAAPAGN